MAAGSWARRVGDGWELTLRVQPGARRAGVVGELGEALKVRVTAPADGGKANAELLRWLADHLGVPPRNVTLLTGAHSRTKRIRVDGEVDHARRHS